MHYALSLAPALLYDDPIPGYDRAADCIGIAPACIAAVALYGGDRLAVTAFHYAYVIKAAVALKVKENKIAGLIWPAAV